MSVDQAAFELGEFLLHGQSSTELARNLFELSLAKNESNVGSLAGLAKINLLQDFDRADELIERAKKVSPSNPWVAIVSGQINNIKRGAAVGGSEKQEYWNRAINDYNLAIKGKDTILQALYSVADMYASKKNWTKYDQVVGAAMELAPSNQRVRYMAIIANIKNGRRDSAEFIANLIRINSHLSSKGLSNFESWYEKQLEKRELMESDAH
jgi:tetratricopeptide (TPR) repeat protein